MVAEAGKYGYKVISYYSLVDIGINGATRFFIDISEETEAGQPYLSLIKFIWLDGTSDFGVFNQNICVCFTQQRLGIGRFFNFGSYFYKIRSERN